MTRPEIALIVVTYQRPRHLALVLESIAAQRGMDSRFELVITDDGSTDESQQVVENFRRRVIFPVGFVTHPHVTFQAARCRNAGAQATTAPYLLFLDGDCILPADHVLKHFQHRKPGTAIIGDACRVDQTMSAKITAETIRRGEFQQLTTDQERRRLRKTAFKYRLYNFLRHPTKPYKLRSGNFGIWREHFERVNGFDENFEGWGGEDDDLGRRLRRAGVRLESIVAHTYSYHLWHPRDATAPDKVKQAANTKYLWRNDAPARCLNGLSKPEPTATAIPGTRSASLLPFARP
jgi:glycosyltransferase involved in cell wall biosynthesis